MAPRNGSLLGEARGPERGAEVKPTDIADSHRK